MVTKLKGVSFTFTKRCTLYGINYSTTDATIHDTDSKVGTISYFFLMWKPRRG